MEFVVTFVVFLFVVTAMAVGVIYGRKPISGTCGGLNNMGADGACEICGGDTAKCEEQSASGRFYDASANKR
ncbi:MAG: (Na+)-NQR maturation NqrM [Pseudomonadales bacterium]|nr:(Na+)-NQR maturation NqrM [Pseudomonadales bacterium]